MGLISELKVENNDISLTFTPTSPFCPMGVQLAMMIKKGLLELEDVSADNISITVEGHLNAEDINKHLAKD